MADAPNAGRRNTSSKLLIALDVFALALTGFALVWVIFFTPREVVMGDVQKVFYFHVSSAWVGMLGFFVAFIAGIAYLRTRRMAWDAAGIAGVEIGFVFTLLAVISGSIWARPIWNTWWTWEPRLTTAFVMLLVYAGYFILRASVDEVEKKARYSGIFAIVAFTVVPLTFISIRLFRTIHPVLFGSGSGGDVFQMTPRMLASFILSLVAFTWLFAALYWNRLRLALADQSAANEQLQLESEAEQ